jgi:hypothetical protein
MEGGGTMATRPRPTRSHSLGAAWEVAAYYRAHNAYGGSESRACKALQRRCPGFTGRQYQNRFRKALALYDRAVELVARHADALWRQTDVEANRFPDFRELVVVIRRSCSGFRVSTYYAALGWVFFWHHLR